MLTELIVAIILPPYMCQIPMLQLELTQCCMLITTKLGESFTKYNLHIGILVKKQNNLLALFIDLSRWYNTR